MENNNLIPVWDELPLIREVLRLPKKGEETKQVLDELKLMEKVGKLNFDTTFKVKEQNLSTLFKGSSFTSETHKLYIFQEEQDKIIGELGDKNRHNTDNFVCELSNETDGSMITKPLPLNFESFRLINFNGCREMVFKVNQEMGVLTCSFNKGDTSLIYIISALIN